MNNFYKLAQLLNTSVAQADATNTPTLANGRNQFIQKEQERQAEEQQKAQQAENDANRKRIIQNMMSGKKLSDAEQEEVNKYKEDIYDKSLGFIGGTGRAFGMPKFLTKTFQNLSKSMAQTSKLNAVVANTITEGKPRRIWGNSLDKFTPSKELVEKLIKEKNPEMIQWKSNPYFKDPTPATSTTVKIPSKVNNWWNPFRKNE